MITGLFEQHDVFDLKPGWGDIPEERRGNLIMGNFKDFQKNIEFGSYDCILANWALCYLGYVEMKQVLVELYSSLKKDGKMILKEPILETTETAPRLCPSG